MHFCINEVYIAYALVVSSPSFNVSISFIKKIQVCIDNLKESGLHCHPNKYCIYTRKCISNSYICICIGIASINIYKQRRKRKTC